MSYEVPNLHSIFEEKDYYLADDENQSLIYKKSPYEYEEFSIKYDKGKFICCVPLKIGVQYKTKFSDYFYAHEYITKHLEYYET